MKNNLLKFSTLHASTVPCGSLGTGDPLYLYTDESDSTRNLEPRFGAGPTPQVVGIWSMHHARACEKICVLITCPARVQLATVTLQGTTLDRATAVFEASDWQGIPPLFCSTHLRAQYITKSI